MVALLLGHRAGHGPGVGPDPAPTWSPLAPDVQQAQWGLAIAAPAEALYGIVLVLFIALMMAMLTMITAKVTDPLPPAVIGIFALATAVFLVSAGVGICHIPTRRRIAKAAREALALASVQDTPTPPER